MKFCSYKGASNAPFCCVYLAVKQIKFAPDLVALIKNGTKTSTWRLFDDKNLAVGDIVEFVARPELSVFAVAKLMKVIEKPFSKLSEEDKEGHEKFTSEEQMYKAYSGYYGQEVGPDTVLKLIWFEILEWK